MVVPELVPPSLHAGRAADRNVALELGFPQASDGNDAEAPRAFVMPRIDDAVPALLRYSSDEANVSVSIAPGGPCTAACLKVAGSF
jgi:hypothetical protein